MPSASAPRSRSHGGDWYDALPRGATFDLIVSNPPYVAPDDPHLDSLRFEPLHALTDRRDGLACLETIVNGACVHLDAEGWLLVEHGYDQAAAVRELFHRAGMAADSRADGAGHGRVTRGRPLGRERNCGGRDRCPLPPFTPV